MSETLTEFLRRYNKNDNTWWRLSSEDRQQYFESACERIGMLERELNEQTKELREKLAKAEERVRGLEQENRTDREIRSARVAELETDLLAERTARAQAETTLLELEQQRDQARECLKEAKQHLSCLLDGTHPEDKTSAQEFLATTALEDGK